jgi:tetratricopeptide (TPR) repeat protein
MIKKYTLTAILFFNAMSLYSVNFAVYESMGTCCSKFMLAAAKRETSDSARKEIEESLSAVLEAEKNKAYSDIIRGIDEHIKDTYSLRNLSFLWSFRGEYDVLLGRYKDALYVCDMAMMFDNDNAHACFVKALAWHKMGRESRAQECIYTASRKGCYLADEIIAAR